ncbi:hypothetical protein WMF30_44870 [Sorangium sp. So ce134]
MRSLRARRNARASILGALNDDDSPLGQGRHLGSQLPDDNEFIDLGGSRPRVE